MSAPDHIHAHDHAPGHGPGDHHHHPARAAGGAADPVCGMSVDPQTAKHVAEHDEARFYFCCAGCQAEFERDPSKYMKTVEA